MYIATALRETMCMYAPCNTLYCCQIHGTSKLKTRYQPTRTSLLGLPLCVQVLGATNAGVTI